MPDLVPVNVTTFAPPLFIPSVSAHQAALVKLVTDVVKQKPTTKTEALELFQTLQIQLATWLVGDLPALEQKAALLGIWAVNEVTSGSCFGLRK